MFKKKKLRLVEMRSYPHDFGVLHANSFDNVNLQNNTQKNPFTI